MKTYYKYVDDNIIVCCKEMQDWTNTGQLKQDGCIKKAQEMIREDYKHESLSMIVNCIHSSAVRKVASL